LPPYIHTSLDNPERYQTVYARITGSVAAPTAGLHFTPELITETKRKGVECLYTTLHIGLDTFRPVSEDDPREHIIHSEYGVLDSDVAVQLREARQKGRKIICVGTTSARLVEQAYLKSSSREIEAFEGWVDLYILPGFTFRMTDALVTNYHLPRSTLLMLVTAFAGRDNITRAYREAIEQGYRFYSFGDAMLIN
jgi:S-adenosylmethionine:tRNA ribosyltransferase-isomerase